MRTFDLNKPLTAAALNESLYKQFNVKINFDKYTREQLEDARNKYRTKISTQESGANFNDLLKNETYQRDKFVLNVLNTRIKEMLGESRLDEKAKSKAQQKFMGMVHAAQKGEKPASKEVAKVAKGMSKKAAKDFAKTKHKGLPAHVDEAHDEPAAPDAEAIAKRKAREAAARRREEKANDAEYGWEVPEKKTKTSAVRKVAGKAYGGAKQKDIDIDEADDHYDDYRKRKMADRLARGISPDEASKFDRTTMTKKGTFSKKVDRYDPATGKLVKQNVGRSKTNEDGNRELADQIEQLLAKGNKVDSRVVGAMGHIVSAEGTHITLAKLNKPTSKIRYSWMLTPKRAEGLEIVKAGPNHYVLRDTDEAWGEPQQSLDLDMANEGKKAKPDFLDVDKDGNKKETFKKAVKDKTMNKKVKEAAKPDFLDMDKDGNKKETMKKAVADKKKKAVKESKSELIHKAYQAFIAEGVASFLAEDEEGKAKSITAAADMVNDFTSWMQRVGNYQTKSMIELADNIRANFGMQEAETFKASVGQALEGALNALTQAREEINNAVAVLAGEAPAQEPMGMDAGLGGEAPEAMPDEMNMPGDEFAASDAAAGGPETTGRLRRESIERGNRLMKILGA